MASFAGQTPEGWERIAKDQQVPAQLQNAKHVYFYRTKKKTDYVL